MGENLYKLIIADDEETIRQGLSHYSKWKELGFEVAAVYEDGAEIVEHLKKGLPVDAILSDIVMSDISGLDVLTYIRDNSIQVKTILLSGYSDFENAQKAISLGASEYLLKPTVLSELREAFTRVKKELDERHRAEKSRELQNLWLSKILLYIICNPSHVDIDELWKVIGIKKSHQNFYWVNISLVIKDKYADISSDIEELLKNSLDFEQEWIVVSNVFRDTIRILVLIPKGKPIEFHKDLIKEKVFLSINVLTGLFDYEIKLNEIIMAENFYEMQNRVERLIGKESNQKKTENVYMGETLFSAIKQNNYTMIKEFLAYSEEHTGLVNTLLIRVTMRLYLQLAHYHIEADRENEPQITNIKKILDQDNNSEMVIRYCYNTIELLEQFLGQRKQIVSRMCEYIDQYVCEGITLQETADYLHYNPSYLSRVFKVSTGESFSTYVKKIKMQHARSLLNNPQMKIYEIAESLGYQDVRHFYKVFKETTGMTPTEYRERDGNVTIAEPGDE